MAEYTTAVIRTHFLLFACTIKELLLAAQRRLIHSMVLWTGLVVGGRAGMFLSRTGTRRIGGRFGVRRFVETFGTERGNRSLRNVVAVQLLRLCL